MNQTLSRRLWLRQIALAVAALVVADRIIAGGSAEETPLALVQQLSDSVLDYLRHHPVADDTSRDALVAFIEKRVLPHFDMGRMTSLAVGPAWRQATAEQRERLTREFQNLLLRTYANAAKAYRDEKLEFAPLRGNPSDQVVRVAARILRSGTDPIDVQYVLEMRNGSWKIIDVVIGGVSLVTNYRSTFAAEINRGGIDALITLLAEKNARGETDPVPGTGEAKKRGG
jgi:phospholipid transport system substrate-binding protein